MKSFKRGVLGVTVAAIAVALVFTAVGVSFAQGPIGDRGGNRGGRGGAVELVRIVTNTAAESVGMDTREFLQSAEAGQTLSDLITANGGDPAQVAADAKGEVETKIDEALANGRITEERAAEMKADLETKIDDILNHEIGQRAIDARVNIGLRREVMDAVIEATGLDRQEVQQGLRDGKSLATIITENGGDVATVKTQIIADATEKINQAVTDGHLAQEDADTLLGELDAHVDELLNFTRMSV
ncbi:MAG: hypothetical protein HY862_18385 [Chloroflexi bacterium]|nr:hypothetical protein [Chloroflexota bacterium]